jgi:hypothetical protein
VWRQPPALPSKNFSKSFGHLNDCPVNPPMEPDFSFHFKAKCHTKNPSHPETKHVLSESFKVLLEDSMDT